MGRSFIAFGFAGFLVAAAVLTGCMSSRPFYEGPDLIPHKPADLSGPEGFCNLSEENGSPRLGLSVENIGEGDVPPSITTIEFFPGGSIHLHTPAVAGGDSIDLVPVVIPLACFDPDCEFRITVDWRNEINESGGEGNNEADGQCRRF